MKITIKNIYSGHRAIILMALCFLVVSAVIGAGGPKKRGRAKKTEVDSRVYLQHANELNYDIYGKHPDAQFVKGNVQFLHKGTRLTCDSALYYQQTNSFEAFGHVKMRQGDTLTMTSEYAYYDGTDEMCEVRRNVVLKHRKMTLYTDSLNYDRLYGVGYFFEGGKIIDGDTKLTSDWGQYNTADRMATFYYNVKLKNKTSLAVGDTLYYDTRTSQAHFVGPSTITTKDDVVKTNDGYYNSRQNRTELYSRSTILRKDGKTITGDSLFLSSNKGVSEGRGNVEFNDPKNKSMFRGNYVSYDETKGEGIAYDRAVAIDYSQGDTLYAHGDTMRLYTHFINTDSVYRVVIGCPHVRIFRRDLQAVCDSMIMNSRDSVLIMYKDPIMWSDGRQVTGEEIDAYMNDSTIRYSHVIGQAFTIEQLPSDTARYNQVSSKDMEQWFDGGKLKLHQAVGNVLTVFYAEDNADSTLIGLNYLETDTMRMYMTPQRKMDHIWACKHSGTLYPISQIPPDKLKLPNFVWFDYIRPKDKDDIYDWIPKHSGTEIRHQKRREAPLQHLQGSAPPVRQAQPGAEQFAPQPEQHKAARKEAVLEQP